MLVLKGSMKCLRGITNRGTLNNHLHSNITKQSSLAFSSMQESLKAKHWQAVNRVQTLRLKGIELDREEIKMRFYLMFNK